MSEYVRAKVGYVAPMPVVPVSSSLDDAKSNLAWDFRDVPIHDGDAIPGGARLETHGFARMQHRTEIADFNEDRAWMPRYRDEAAELIKRLSGADEVIVPIKGSRMGSSKRQGSGGTIAFCHNDFTAISAGELVHEIDTTRSAERLRRRFTIYNLWRLTSPPPQNRPLALCDPSSIAVADVVPGQTHWGNETYHQNVLLRYNPLHRWYYYPGLRTNELLIWVGYDSDPRFPSVVPHVAFDDPECTDPSAYRTNVECRAYAFFDA